MDSKAHAIRKAIRPPFGDLVTYLLCDSRAVLVWHSQAKNTFNQLYTPLHKVAIYSTEFSTG